MHVFCYAITMKRFLLLLLVLMSCSHLPPAPSKPDPIPQVEEKPPRHSLTLLATGDNLLHETILTSSPDYDFTPLYTKVKSLIESADLAFVNQETVMAGEKFGYSGYPRFNTPQTLAKTLAETGFDIVNHANNHAMDMGPDGLLSTMDLWDSMPGLVCIGVQRSEEKQHIITKNNIRLGFLAYTYGLNGFMLPKDKPWLVSLINREKMAEDIDTLRPLCDFLIVSMHWGDEYDLEPSAAQLGLASFLAEHNVDLVIGHHPHVLQRFELLPRPDGKNTFCFYSLGNFVSHQRQKEKILGALLYVKFEKEDAELSITDTGLIPVVSHFDQKYLNTSVFPLYSYTKELLNEHRNVWDKSMTMEYFYSALPRLQTNIILNNPFM
ncbi:capsular polysaccharide biosynthesis protein [Spirochaetia bacterium]|nr:capsular polysaccharide biosynthesis protein [Spirochaetia bacterium]